MAGIYIHIPFCKRACHYCNFHFSTSMKSKNDFLHALLKEMQLRQNYLGNSKIDTIYFGGGTPSILPLPDLKLIFKTLHHSFDIGSDAEITFEANPDDVTAENVAGWREAGINRFSLGVQSFFEEDLQWMNRAHSSAQALTSIPMLQAAGFNNLTIDLIYGSPGLTDDKWKQNVETALALGIPHLSCYALTVEPHTALDKMIRTNKSKPVHSEHQARQFTLLMDWLGKAGYEHYEISNFALPGMRSKHNSAYWSGDAYLGLGPSAHSYDGKTRQWNIANNARYISSISTGVVPSEIEQLDQKARHNEYVMISLRKKEGINREKFRSIFGAPLLATLEQQISKYLANDWVITDGDNYRLSNEGKLFADGIAADLFW